MLGHEKNTLNGKDFLLGFFVGVSVTALTCFIILMAFGGLPMQMVNTTATTETTQTNDGPTAVDTTNNTDPTAEDYSQKNIPIPADAHIRGNVDAPITIVEYSDVQCPFCQTFHNNMEQIIAEYGDDVRWVYKHFPLDQLHPFARQGAQAAECAGEQEMFWEYTDLLYARQNEIAPASFAVFAEDLGLNVGDFNSCLDSGRYAEKVEAEFQEGLAVGVRGTPGTFFNGYPLQGAVPYGTMKSLIDQELSK